LENFKALVEKIWNAPVSRKNPIEVWQENIRKLRKTTKGQSANTEVDLRKLKKGLMDEYNRSDIKSESIELS
jgi:hypothetical protein